MVCSRLFGSSNTNSSRSSSNSNSNSNNKQYWQEQSVGFLCGFWHCNVMFQLGWIKIMESWPVSLASLPIARGHVSSSPVQI